MSVTGIAFRVYCPECEVENVVDSELLAKDLVDAHEEDRNCSAADWEEVDDE